MSTASGSLAMSFSTDQVACVCEALQQAGDMEVSSFFFKLNSLLNQVIHYVFVAFVTIPVVTSGIRIER